MRYTIHEECKSPAYLQLYEQIREDIVKKIYHYGEKLPSKRTVAAETGVSTVTVEHAYALLSEEGYIEARERSGYFVIFKTDLRFASFEYSEKKKKGEEDEEETEEPDETEETEIEGLFRFGENGISPILSGGTAPKELLFPASVLKKTVRSVLTSQGEALFRRSPGEGTTVLREALMEYLRRSRGIEADLEQIIIGAGSEYLYTLNMDLLGRNRIYGIESPSYKKIAQVYDLAKVKYEMLPLGPEGIDSAALWKSSAEILHISPYRSYPSRVTASASKRHEYLHWASMEGRYIVEDDFESEFSVSTKPEETLFSNTKADNVLYMNTFSKTISPALRVGYTVIPRHLVPKFHEKLGFCSSTVSTFIQYVLAELLSSGNFERHINRVRRAKRKHLQNK